MEILRLGGENIASFKKPFTIDFTAPPLCHTGLFIITGNTGAGKSTLLDALCLALYNRTPRLEYGKEKGKGTWDVSGDWLEANDTRQALRRGATYGNAWVEFRAIDGRPYRAQWSVKRAYNKPNGKLQSVSMSLHQLPSMICLAEGRNLECLHAIESLVGLNYAQFTRVVLLAQGEFAQFLKAPTKEKAELLEKLTDTKLFSDLSITIFNTHKQYKEKLAFLENQRKEIPLLSEEEQKGIMRTIKLQEEQFSLMQQQQTKLQEQKNQREQLTLLNNQLQEAQQELQKQKKIRQESLPQQQQLALWDQAQPMVMPWQELQKTKALSQQTAHTLQTLQQTLTALQQEKRTLEEEKERFRTLEEQGKQSIALTEKAILQAQEQEKHMQPLLEELKQMQTEVQDMQEQVTKHQEIYKATYGQMTKLQTSLATLQTQHETMAKYQSLYDAWPQLAPHIDSLQEHHTLIQQKSTSLKRLYTDLQQLQQRLTTQQEHLDKLRTQFPQEALTLRATLSPGAPCPVCGSTHHPYAGKMEQTLASSQQALQQEEKQYTQAIEQTQQRIQAMQIEHATDTRLLQQYQTQQEQLLTMLQPTLAPLLPTWKETIFSPQWKTTITQKASQWSTLEKDLWEQKKQLEHLSSLCQNQKESLNDKTTLFQQLTQKHCSLQKRSQEMQELIKKTLRGCSIADLTQRIEKKRKNLLEKHDSLQKKREEFLRRETQNTEQIKHTSLTLTQTQEQEGVLNRTLEQWRQEHLSLFPSPQALSLILQLDPSHMQTLRMQLEEQGRLFHQAQAIYTQQKEHQAQYTQTLPPTLPSAQEIQQALKENKLQQQTAQNKLIQAHTALTRHQQQQAQHQKISSRIEHLTPLLTQWEQLKELYGSAQGDKFRIIAQSYTLLTLLQHANNHLATIMPRYQIWPQKRKENTLQANLSLQIVDLHLMEEKRPAETLSGGETFLISLALALGLSHLAAHGQGVQFLFIDEGFGALDTENLSLALNALERLQTQSGRRVGIISHVQELQERIPVQIHVEKHAPTESRLHIRSSL